MLYEINNKYYIKVGGFYKEVIIDVVRDELVIKPTKSKIEISEVSNYNQIDVNSNRKQIINSITDNKKMEKRHIDDEKPNNKRNFR